MSSSRIITAGATSQSVPLRAVTTATGVPVTLTSASAGLALWYRRNGTGLKVAITPSDLALLSTAWSAGGMLLIGDGVHRVDVADAAFASGAASVVIGGSATGVDIEPCVVQLTGQDLQTALTPATILAATVDGVALSNIIGGMLAAYLGGKCVVTDNGGTVTYAFRNQADSADVVTLTPAKTDASRANTSTPSL